MKQENKKELLQEDKEWIAKLDQIHHKWAQKALEQGDSKESILQKVEDLEAEL